MGRVKEGFVSRGFPRSPPQALPTQLPCNGNVHWWQEMLDDGSWTPPRLIETNTHDTAQHTHGGGAWLLVLHAV